MSYLCGLISCNREEKCSKYADGCYHCKWAHYNPVTASNVACYPEKEVTGGEDKPE